MVVSEIGDIWSPHTAPERIAATFIVISGLASPKIAITIGTNIPNPSAYWKLMIVLVEYLFRE